MIDSRTTHPLYRTWISMVSRCTNPHSKSWANYGGRGIRVCPAWSDSRTFLDEVTETLGERPEGCSLDRIDNDGDYAPGNVRWATAKVQARNRRTNRLTEAQVNEIRWYLAQGLLDQRYLAGLYGISQPLVCRIGTGAKWS